MLTALTSPEVFGLENAGNWCSPRDLPKCKGIFLIFWLSVVSVSLAEGTALTSQDSNQQSTDQILVVLPVPSPTDTPTDNKQSRILNHL